MKKEMTALLFYFYTEIGRTICKNQFTFAVIVALYANGHSAKM